MIGVQCGQENTNPKFQYSSEKLGMASFPLNGGLKGWDFPVNTEEQCSIPHIPILHLSMYCTLFVGDVTELMLTMACSTEKGQLFVGPTITA